MKPASVGGGDPGPVIPAVEGWYFAADGPRPEVATGSGRTLGDIGTIEGWIYPTWNPADADGPGTILALGGSYGLTVRVNVDKTAIMVNGTECPVADLDGYHHLALFPADGDVWVDGDLVGSWDPDDAAASLSLDGLHLGGVPVGSMVAESFTGYILGLRLWQGLLEAPTLALSAELARMHPTAPLPETVPDAIELPLDDLVASMTGASSERMVYVPSRGPWVNRADDGAVPTQRRFPGVDSESHGFYEVTQYLVILYEPEGRTLVGSVGGPWRLRPSDVGDDTLTVLDSAGTIAASITIADSGRRFRIDGSGDPHLPNGRYTLPTAQTGRQWNEGFSTVPGNLDFSLLGWDVRAADLPPTCPTSTGVEQALFEGMDTTTAAFHMETLAKGEYAALPLGLRYAPRSTSSFHSTTNSATNSFEFSQSHAWGFNVGTEVDGNIGLYDADVSINVNQQYQAARTDAEERSGSRTLATATVTEYTLVLDQAAVVLSTRFKDLVAEMADDGHLRDLFDIFGTHYAYAVTYGGRAWRQISMDEHAITTMLSGGESLEADGKLKLGIGLKEQGVHDTVKGGGKDTHDHEKTTSNRTGVQVDDIRSYGSITGLEGIHEGGLNPLPVYVQLRRISDLLRPPYFHDRATIIDLRSRVDATLDAVLAEAASTDGNWGLYFVEISGPTLPDEVTLEVHAVTEDQANDPTKPVKKLTCPTHNIQVDFAAMRAATYVGEPDTIGFAWGAIRRLDELSTQPVHVMVHAYGDDLVVDVWDTVSKERQRWPIPVPDRGDTDKPYHDDGWFTATVVPSDSVLNGAWT